MSPRLLFFISLGVAAIFGVVAFAPIPNNPLSLRSLVKTLGLGEKKESRYTVTKEQQEKAARDSRERLDALEQDQKFLMENRKDQLQQFQDSSQQQLIDPVELHQQAQQQAEIIQQQKDRLMEEQQTEEERQRELKEQQDRQMMDLRQKIKDQQDMIRDRTNNW